VWKKDLRQVNYLKSQGYTVIRFWKKEIRENVDCCVQIILQAIKQKKSKPNNSTNQCMCGYDYGYICHIWKLLYYSQQITL
jgi:G:T-mismatch repair DNA endonuclease (very short patch repair protein)